MPNLNEALVLTPAVDKKALRNKLLLAIIVVFLSLPLIYWLLDNADLEQDKLLDIQGIVLNQPTSISPFSLINHNHKYFTDKDLQGKWHIVAYGYTQCPDICPTTLMAIADLADLLRQAQQLNDVKFLFYTIDPIRDSVDVLSQYIEYFDNSFIALRPDEGSSFQYFERNLGIKANVVQTPDENNGITVSHNLSVVIINPEAKLQAVLLPEKRQSKTMPISQVHFTGQQLYRDFSTVRSHFQQQQSGL